MFQKGEDPGRLEFDGVKAYQLLQLPLAFLVVMACDPLARQQIRDANDKFVGYLMQVCLEFLSIRLSTYLLSAI